MWDSGTTINIHNFPLETDELSVTMGLPGQNLLQNSPVECVKRGCLGYSTKWIPTGAIVLAVPETHAVPLHARRTL